MIRKNYLLIYDSCVGVDLCIIGWDSCKQDLQSVEGEPGEWEAHGGIWETRQWCK